MIANTFWRVLAAAALFVSTSILAEEKSGFKIIYDKPEQELEKIVGSAWWIYIDGEIDDEAGRRFEEFLVKHHVPIRSIVILNSPGGSLYGGMELGRIIRQHYLETDVGVRRTKPGGDRSYGPGECYSSCTYAYLGGVFRYMQEGSHYGVHRFYADHPNADDIDKAQITSAQLVTYIREMDVDPEFFNLSTVAGADDIYEPQRALLKKLGVINDGFTLPKWTIESVKGNIYLKGERDTRFGANKVLISCLEPNANKIGLYILIHPQGHEQELLKLPAHFLEIDEDMQPLTPLTKDVENDWFRALYAITNKQAAAIMKAKTMGVVITTDANAPLVLGIQSMPLKDAAEKLAGIIKTCRSQRR